MTKRPTDAIKEEDISGRLPYARRQMYGKSPRSAVQISNSPIPSHMTSVLTFIPNVTDPDIMLQPAPRARRQQVPPVRSAPVDDSNAPPPLPRQVPAGRHGGAPLPSNFSFPGRMGASMLPQSQPGSTSLPTPTSGPIMPPNHEHPGKSSSGHDVPLNDTNTDKATQSLLSYQQQRPSRQAAPLPPSSSSVPQYRAPPIQKPGRGLSVEDMRNFETTHPYITRVPRYREIIPYRIPTGQRYRFNRTNLVASAPGSRKGSKPLLFPEQSEDSNSESDAQDSGPDDRALSEGNTPVLRKRAQPVCKFTNSLLNHC